MWQTGQIKDNYADWKIFLYAVVILYARNYLTLSFSLSFFLSLSLSPSIPPSLPLSLSLSRDLSLYMIYFCSFQCNFGSHVACHLFSIYYYIVAVKDVNDWCGWKIFGKKWVEKLSNASCIPLSQSSSIVIGYNYLNQGSIPRGRAIHTTPQGSQRNQKPLSHHFLFIHLKKQLLWDDYQLPTMYPY